MHKINRNFAVGLQITINTMLFEIAICSLHPAKDTNGYRKTYTKNRIVVCSFVQLKFSV